MQCSAHALFGTRDLPDIPAPAPAQPPRTPQLVFACPPRSPRTLAPHALAQACVWLAKSGGREAHTPAGHLQGRPGFGARPRRPLRPVPAGGVGLVGVRAVRLRSLSGGRAVETEQQEAAPARSSGPGRGRRPRCPACLCGVSLRSDTQVRACFLLSFSGLLLTGTPEFRLLKNRLVFSF